MSVNVSRHPGRLARSAAARRAGLLDGVASVFRLSGRGRPAPVLARRRYGSLREDGRALQRDGERLFRGDAR
jgi:hypothetical protein